MILEGLMVSILIVEDDASLQFLYKQVLLLNGFTIFGIASNGMEALELFQKHPEKPDVILMDHRMPIKTGLEATREILALDSSAKIIFTSADSSIKKEAFALGIICFKDKPFTIENLISNIKKAVNLK